MKEVTWIYMYLVRALIWDAFASWIMHNNFIFQCMYYCTKNKTSHRTAAKSQWYAMIWKKTTGRDRDVDSDTVCLVGLFLAHTSIVTIRTVRPLASVFEMFRGSLDYLLHSLELQKVLYRSAPLLSGSQTLTIIITYRVYLTNCYVARSLTQ